MNPFMENLQAHRIFIFIKWKKMTIRLKNLLKLMYTF